MAEYNVEIIKSKLTMIAEPKLLTPINTLYTSGILQYAFIAGGFARDLSMTILQQEADSGTLIRVNNRNEPIFSKGSKYVISYSDIDLFLYDQNNVETSLDILNKIGKFIPPKNDRFSMAYSYEIDSADERFRVQLIKPISARNIVTFGTVKDILDTFDLTCCQFAIADMDSRGNLASIFNEYSVSDTVNRKLVIHQQHIRSPISALFRVIKYSRKGYHLSWIESLKLFTAWSTMLKEDREALARLLYNTSEGTLTEVDMAELEAIIIPDLLIPQDKIVPPIPRSTLINTMTEMARREQ